MDTYRVRLTDGQTFLMRADMTQASAPILAHFHGGDEEESAWCHVPYQTADAGHDETRAARLVAEYCRADADDCGEVESVTEIADPRTEESGDSNDDDFDA